MHQPEAGYENGSQGVYETWAAELATSPPFGVIKDRVLSDYTKLTEAPVLLRPAIDSLQTLLDLEVREGEPERQAYIDARFIKRRLFSLIMTVGDDFSVRLNFSHRAWPVELTRVRRPITQPRYDYSHFSLARYPWLREQVDRTVLRVSRGIDYNVRRRLPVGIANAATDMMFIGDADLPWQAREALSAAKIETVSQLGRLTMAELSDIMGPRSLAAVMGFLRHHGLAIE